MLNILVICNGNSCRSIIGEAIFNHLGKGRINAFSAGCNPKGRVNSGALELLQRHGLNIEGLSSKSWYSLSHQPFDIIITVCDNAAKETCPSYLTPALKAHWEAHEPSHTVGGEKEIKMAFENTFIIFEQRINRILALPLEKMNSNDLANALKTID